jgi:hypothetical protein
MLRTLVCALLVGAVSASAQQELGHRFAVTPSAGRAAVGDPVTLRFEVSLHERDLITDSVPRPAGELAEGVRILAMRKLERRGDRALQGEATVAFYRTGVQQLPTFEIPFLRVSANMRGTIRSEPLPVEIAPTIPAGNPSIKDLKDLVPTGGTDWLPVGVGAGAVGVFVLALRAWRRRVARKAAVAAAPHLRPSAPLPDPFTSALARLEGIDPLDVPAAADVVRAVLADAANVPALGWTSAELLRTLPPHLRTEGNAERLAELLRSADLVKFAQGRTPPSAGQAFLDTARALLNSWRAALGFPRGAADATG